MGLHTLSGGYKVPTFASGTSPYCTAAQFSMFVDTRSISQLLSDSDAPIDVTTFTTNTTLALFLQAASGMIESAATAAGAYVIDPTVTPARNDLASLTGNSSAQLAWMVASLTWWLLWSRRPNEAEMPAQCKMAMEWLDKLRRGERILGIKDVALAGQPLITLDSPTTWDNRATTVTHARRFFGNRIKDYDQTP